MRGAIYLAAILLLALGYEDARAADTANPNTFVVREGVYPKRHTYRVYYPKCRVREVCSLYGAYGPDGGPQFWGAYTGWGYYSTR